MVYALIQSGHYEHIAKILAAVKGNAGLPSQAPTLSEFLQAIGAALGEGRGSAVGQDLSATP